MQVVPFLNCLQNCYNVPKWASLLFLLSEMWIQRARHCVSSFGPLYEHQPYEDFAVKECTSGAWFRPSQCAEALNMLSALSWVPDCGWSCRNRPAGGCGSWGECLVWNLSTLRFRSSRTQIWPPWLNDEIFQRTPKSLTSYFRVIIILKEEARKISEAKKQECFWKASLASLLNRFSNHGVQWVSDWCLNEDWISRRQTVSYRRQCHLGYGVKSYQTTKCKRQEPWVHLSFQTQLGCL